jgi:hypothetical protein
MPLPHNTTQQCTSLYIVLHATMQQHTTGYTTQHHMPTWISTQGGVSGMAAAMKPRSAKMPPDMRMKVQMRQGHV